MPDFHSLNVECSGKREPIFISDRNRLKRGPACSPWMGWVDLSSVPPPQYSIQPPRSIHSLVDGTKATLRALAFATPGLKSLQEWSEHLC